MKSELLIPIGASFLGGGLAGSILTNAVTAYRNRLQPIEKEIKVVRVFRDSIGSKGLKANITIEKNGQEFKYSNLYMVNIKIKNIGNADYETFRIGITLKPNRNIVDIRPKTADRLHKITVQTEIDPTNPQEFADLVCEPFIRKYEYRIRLAVVSELSTKMLSPDDITLSSTAPITFVDSNRIGKTAIQLATDFFKGADFPFRV